MHFSSTIFLYIYLYAETDFGVHTAYHTHVFDMHTIRYNRLL